MARHYALHYYDACEEERAIILRDPDEVAERVYRLRKAGISFKSFELEIHGTVPVALREVNF